MMKTIFETLDPFVMPLTFFVMLHLVVLYIILPLVIFIVV